MTFVFEHPILHAMGPGLGEIIEMRVEEWWVRTKEHGLFDPCTNPPVWVYFRLKCQCGVYVSAARRDGDRRFRAHGGAIRRHVALGCARRAA